MTCNRGKESLALDFRTDAGREVLVRLIAQSQVLVHNFRPDFSEKNALTYEDVRKINPEIIYAMVSAFGGDSAYRLRPSVDSVVQGMTGAFYASGEEGDPPVRIGLPIIDVASGMCGALGVLAAVMHWQQTGRGQRVELALADTIFNFMAAKVGEHAVEQREPVRSVNLPIAVPSRHFQGSDGAWFSVSVVNEGAFRRFCGVVNQPAWLTDQRYNRNFARVANRPALLAELAAIFAKRPAAEWVAAFEAADIPCGPVNTVAAAMSDPVLADRFVEHPALPGLPMIPFPARLAEGMHRPETMPPPPILGQNTMAVLSEVGYAQHEIERLGATGVVRLGNVAQKMEQ
ncbi:CaiB/BaiF CoA transferase family protein [Ottowia sp. VDI28]|uniref:CaiB/BaiF CoA transferase family protein n=1 Tax=Ottowia sp. VDI28 TaxID=3133968 RepID=UPI003C2F93AB